MACKEKERAHAARASSQVRSFPVKQGQLQIPKDLQPRCPLKGRCFRGVPGLQPRVGINQF